MARKKSKYMGVKAKAPDWNRSLTGKRAKAKYGSLKKKR